MIPCNKKDFSHRRRRKEIMDMRRKFPLLIMLLAIVASAVPASASASKRYEAGGDPVVLCAGPLAARTSSEGACFDVSGAVESHLSITIQDDYVFSVLAKYRFLDAFGVPIYSSAYDALYGGTLCGYSEPIAIPSEAVSLQVKLERTTILSFTFCEQGTSGSITVDFFDHVASQYPY